MITIASISKKDDPGNPDAGQLVKEVEKLAERVKKIQHSPGARLTPASLDHKDAQDPRKVRDLKRT